MNGKEEGKSLTFCVGDGEKSIKLSDNGLTGQSFYEIGHGTVGDNYKCRLLFLIEMISISRTVVLRVTGKADGKFSK